MLRLPPFSTAPAAARELFGLLDTSRLWTHGQPSHGAPLLQLPEGAVGQPPAAYFFFWAFFHAMYTFPSSHPPPLLKVVEHEAT